MELLTSFKMHRKRRLESQLKTYRNIIPLSSQSHGTIEQLELEGMLEITQFHGKGCYLPDQFAQGHIQLGCGQRWSDTSTEQPELRTAASSSASSVTQTSLGRRWCPFLSRTHCFFSNKHLQQTQQHEQLLWHRQEKGEIPAPAESMQPDCREPLGQRDLCRMHRWSRDTLRVQGLTIWGAFVS